MKKRIYKVVYALLAALVVVSPMRVKSSAINKNVQISSRITELLFGKASEERTLCVGGGIFGARIKQSYVSVVEARSVPKLHSGDIIAMIEDTEINEVADIESILAKCDGKPLKILIKRGGNSFCTEVTPQLSNGVYKLGIKLKDTASGIGTVTFIDKESGLFGGLGHGICDIESGELVGLSEGRMTGVLLGGINRGEVGKPGELCGVLTGRTTGIILQNSDCGVFGKIDSSALDYTNYEELTVAKSDAVHTGAAEILCTVKNGAPRRYSVEITEISTDGAPTKSFKLRVTDKTLIAITGGIVRGMSGSPIIQDGKLVGAVTHVMVADPTEGYGIFIENMLSAAEMPMQNAA